MATTRPLMQLGIGELEDIFEKQIKNLATLGRLKHELNHRQVPRAIALLERVKKAEAMLEAVDSQRVPPKSPRSTARLKPHTPASAPVSISKSLRPEINPSEDGLRMATGQLDLLTGFQQPPEPAKPKAPHAGTSDAVTAQKPQTAAELEALPQLALEDACRILKVGLGDTWEKVEAARRKIVTKSSPLATTGLSPVQAQKLLAEAQKANDAAIVIAARRSGRQ